MKPHLVLIEWNDSHSYNEWHRDNPARTPLKCISVGYLMYNGKKVKTVAGHVAQDFQQRGAEMSIPASAITRISRLAVKR